jgi:hypothetical protein
VVEGERIRRENGCFLRFVAGGKFREGRGLIWSGGKGRGKRRLHGGVLEELFFEIVY